jgi:hypothetical protein
MSRGLLAQPARHAGFAGRIRSLAWTLGSGENLVLNMTADQWISLIASIAGCLAAFAAFLAIWQSSKQREMSYRAEILIDRTEFEFSSFSKEENEIFPDELRNKGGVDRSENGPMWFTVPIRNIGLGAAKWVRVEWSFPVSKFVKEINKLSQEVVNSDLFDFENGNLKLVYGNAPRRTSFWENQRNATLDHLLPTGVGGDPEYLIVPPTFSLLVSAMVRLSALSNCIGSLPEIPALCAKISYKDIGGKKHRIELPLATHVVLSSGKGAEFAGYLEGEN